MAAFDFEQGCKQVPGCESCLDFRHRIDKIGLLKPSNRGAAIERGAPQHAGGRKLRQLGERASKVGQRIIQIAAECNESPRDRALE
jgi:hypothetical protein